MEKRGLHKKSDNPGKIPAVLFLLIYLLIFIFLALRKPDALLNPQLYADDGFIFLFNSIFNSLSETIWLPHGKYLHVFPHLVASPFNIYNFHTAPFVFNMVGLAVHALSVALLLLPSCERILPLRFRIVAVGILCTLPWHSQTYIWLSGAHYYLFISLVLLSLLDLSGSGWAGKTVAFVFMIITVLSSPNVILLAPIWIFKIFRHFQHRNFAFSFALVGLLLTVISALITLTMPLDAPIALSELEFMLFPEFMARSVGVEVVANNLIGQAYRGRLTGESLFFWTSTLAFLVALITYLIFQFKHRSIKLVDFVLPYLIIAPIVLTFMTKPRYVNLFVNLDNFIVANRFSVIPSFFFILFLLRMVYRIQLHLKFNKTVIIISGLFVGYLGIAIVNFQYPKTEDFKWSYHVCTYYRKLLYTPNTGSKKGFYRIPYPGPFQWHLPLRLFEPNDEQRGKIIAALTRIEDPRNTISKKN